ncbi:hypothetical protein AJ80_01632 [Polytolypa hystricis UAMH7299]|uniref:Mediator of RNA polymerase II transcription subunit 12 n=1 Tax=Polytolypa hystricis (strain UAMH7299) TaxID=1447883 RepID=A0A2B7YYC5_POLH7|nr:hypothetical protein AJ80_01632 [Polytolypa hystricis UAMH7299]
MTPHSSTAIPQLPLPRAVPSRTSGRPSASQPDPTLTSHVPHNAVVIDLSDNNYGTSGGDRPAKRLKLDAGVDMLDPGRMSAGVDLQPSINPSDLRRQFPSDASGGRQTWSTREGTIRTGQGGSMQDGNSEGEAQWSRPASLPPFPIRPWKYKPPKRHTAGVTHSKPIISADAVKTTPFRFQTPSDAPRVIAEKHADFYPWVGSHPEDVLTEQTSKQGFYDRVQVSQNESNTARPSLFAQFKHRAGLKLLSAVFTTALEKRQASSQVTASSTFRPPPRVTLTDNKREAWLRDLANASVPLRRLSRTIPHGIRGKVLLDQCLSKSIPIGRAIWLAKCVGANEIRAFKRKGTSAAVASGLEAKWVKDWTMNVQQFVEGVLGNCGEPDWKAKMSYALRLAARLFGEHLLDQDVFLEWFLTSLDTSSLNTLPAWLLMAGVYWESLVRYRKRGRRLAETLLEKLRQAQSFNHNNILHPITSRLSVLIKRFVQTRPSCFVLPQTWSKYQPVLFSCLNPGDQEEQLILAKLSDRNERVQRSKDVEKTAQKSPTQCLIRLLDSFCSSNDFSALSSECLKLPIDQSALIGKIMEWASTSFRAGLCRTYVAVRLLRRWKRCGVDIDSDILSFLAENHRGKGLRKMDIFHVISELIRSQSFSVGRYLQWLMARGVVHSKVLVGQTNGSTDVELLCHIPLCRLPEHVWNLRNTLLARTGYSVSGETRHTQLIKSFLKRRLPEIFSEDGGSEDHDMTDDINFATLSWTVKSHIGQWLRDHVASHIKSCLKSAMDNDFACDIKISRLTPDEFFEIRHVLECLSDLSMLADVLKHASRSDDAIVLASAADTLNYHFDSFNAIGATRDLFKSFTEAYVRVSKTDPPNTDLITSLLDVVIKVPDEIATLAVLRRDLVQLDRKLGIAASSPVSDHMADGLNTANPTFTEELNQLLASGNTMDEQTMARIFETLSKRLGSERTDLKLGTNEIARYLAQLRTFNTKTFDSLMVKWMVHFLKSAPRPSLVLILPPLIGVGCVTFQAFSSLVKAVVSSGSQREMIPDRLRLYLDMLRLLDTKEAADGPFLDLVLYRFKIARREYLSQCPFDVLSLVQDILVELSGSTATLAESDHGYALKDLILPLLREQIVSHQDIDSRDGVDKVLTKYPTCADVIHQALFSLLGLQAEGALAVVDDTMQLINDLSLPLCLAQLRLHFNTVSDDETKTKVLDLLFKTAESGVQSGNSHWRDVLGVLQADAAQHVRRRAESQILSMLLPPALQHSAADESSETTNPSRTSLVYLRIVEDLAYSIADGGASGFGASLVEKMNMLLQRVVLLSNETKNSDNPGVNGDAASGLAPAPQEQAIALWFYVLLRIVAIHHSTLSSTATSKSDLVDRTRLLITICCIALSPIFSKTQRFRFPSTIPLPPSKFQLDRSITAANLQVQALDVAATLVDSLPDEARQQCVRFLRERCPPFLQPQNDPRLLFLLGPLTDTPPPSSTPSQLPAPQNSQIAAGAANLAAPLPSHSFPASNSNNMTPTAAEDSNSLMSKLRFQQRGRIIGPYPMRAWEMLEESAPIVGVNDTALNLGYFGARQTRG